jgi:hypothetical protein
MVKLNAKMFQKKILGFILPLLSNPGKQTVLERALL